MLFLNFSFVSIRHHTHHTQCHWTIPKWNSPSFAPVELFTFHLLESNIHFTFRRQLFRQRLIQRTSICINPLESYPTKADRPDDELCQSDSRSEEEPTLSIAVSTDRLDHFDAPHNHVDPCKLYLQLNQGNKDGSQFESQVANLQPVRSRSLGFRSDTELHRFGVIGAGFAGLAVTYHLLVWLVRSALS